MDEPDSSMKLVARLCRYLRENPQACDTPEGMARWWLGGDTAAGRELQRALDWLERAGLIEPLRAVDGRTRYRRSAQDAPSDARLDLLAKNI